MSAIFTTESDALSAVFSALSDPTRRAMLARLSQGEASVNELAAPFKMSLPAVSKHIKVLEKAGLLTKTVSAQQRPCKIDGVQLKQAVDWIDQYKQLWEGRLDRLDAYLVGLHASEMAAKSMPEKAEKPDKAAKSTKKTSKTTKKNTTKSIAKEALNTPTRGKKDLKKLKIIEKTTKTAQKPTQNQEKNHGNSETNDPNNVQQQIGFDF